MLTLSIISPIFFSIGLLLLILNFGIQPSLSENYYRLKEKKLGVLFYAYLVITALLLIAPLCEYGGIFGFLTAAGLCFVGAAAAFKDDKTQRKVHVGGAIASAGGAVGTLIKIKMIKYTLIVVPVIILIAALTKKIKTSYIFWLEMCAFYSLFLGMIIFLA